MNPNDQSETWDRQQVEAHRTEAENAMYNELNRIFRLSEDLMTAKDKEFLHARQSYLTTAQKAQYAGIIETDLALDPKAFQRKKKA